MNNFGDGIRKRHCYRGWNGGYGYYQRGWNNSGYGRGYYQPCYRPVYYYLATVPFIIVQRQRSSLGLDAANLGRYYWVGFSRERVTNPEGAQFLWM